MAFRGGIAALVCAFDMMRVPTCTDRGFLLLCSAVRWKAVFSAQTRLYAGVAELADAPDLGSGGETREGSSPFARTIYSE